MEQMQTGVPCVTNAVDRMSQLENGRLVTEAHQLYRTLMEKEFQTQVPDDEEFSRLSSASRQQAVDLFRQQTIFDEDQQFLKQLCVSMHAPTWLT